MAWTTRKGKAYCSLQVEVIQSTVDLDFYIYYDKLLAVKGFKKGVFFLVYRDISELVEGVEPYFNIPGNVIVKIINTKSPNSFNWMIRWVCFIILVIK